MNCPFCAEPMNAADTKCKACGEALVKRPSVLSGGDPIDPMQILGWAMKDPNWITKGLIGAACFLGMVFFFIPFFALIGYKLRCARQQLESPGAEPMPEWDDFFGLVGDGLKLMLSVFLLMFVLALLAGLFIGAMAAIDIATSGQPGPFMGIAGVVCYFGFILFTMIFQIVFLPAIELEYLETGSLTSAMHFGSLWRRMSTRFGDYLTMAVVYFLIGMIAQMAGFLLLCIGIYFTTPVGMFTQGALLGRYLAQQRAKDAALQS